MNTNNISVPIFDSTDQVKLVHFVQAGKVGVMPTDTIYGLVASAANQESVTRLYALKRRHAKPGTIIAASVDQLIALGIQRRYLKAVADYWPNSLSVVVPVGPELDYLSLGVRSLAVRIPDDENLLTLLSEMGPLLTSSANQPHEPSATSLAECQGYFGDQVDFYCDGGSLANRKPSTIIRIVDDAIEILREGAVKIDEFGHFG